MLNEDESFFYCFNERCSSSLLNVNQYSSIRVDLKTAMAYNFDCPVCGAELISTMFSMMKKNILELVKTEQANVILLDDDLMFHHFVKELFNEDLMTAAYYTDGYAVLNYLTFNIDHENTLPDIIFLDLNMPILDGWNFLELFKVVTKSLTKKIEVYIISNSLTADNEVDLSLYPFVKCFISKASTLEFFKMLNLEMAARSAKRPAITLQVCV